jgi:hypothetical protein
MLGLLFAQGVAAAHAGSVPLTAGSVFATMATATSPAATAAPVTGVDPDGEVVRMPCHGHAAGGPAAGPAAVAVADANACEVHCTDLTPSAFAPELPPAAPSPALRVDVAVVPPPASAAIAQLEARGAAPPVRLAYVRFLI